jgi:hypothetical protein
MAGIRLSRAEGEDRGQLERMGEHVDRHKDCTRVTEVSDAYSGWLIVCRATSTSDCKTATRRLSLSRR